MIVRNRQCVCSSDAEIRQELSFTVELTLDRACRLVTQNILFSFFSPVLFVLRT